MGWSVGYDENWKRDIGYGVPAQCDHVECEEEIDRGLGWVCGGEPFGGDDGCGLFFCSTHLYHGSGDGPMQQCERCAAGDDPFEPSADLYEWTHHKANDPSWAEWRAEQNA